MKTIPEFIQKYGLAVYAALFLGLLAGGLLWPSYANQAAAITLGLVMTVAVALVIRGQAAACRQGRLERSSLAANIIIDSLGVLLVTGAALLAGGWRGRRPVVAWTPPVPPGPASWPGLRRVRSPAGWRSRP